MRDFRPKPLRFFVDYHAGRPPRRVLAEVTACEIRGLELAASAAAKAGVPFTALALGFAPTRTSEIGGERVIHEAELRDVSLVGEHAGALPISNDFVPPPLWRQVLSTVVQVFCDWRAERTARALARWSRWRDRARRWRSPLVLFVVLVAAAGSGSRPGVGLPSFNLAATCTPPVETIAARGGPLSRWAAAQIFVVADRRGRLEAGGKGLACRIADNVGKASR